MSFKGSGRPTTDRHPPESDGAGQLGFVPNVLASYAFDMAKLEAFVAMYNDLMLAPPASPSSSGR